MFVVVPISIMCFDRSEMVTVDNFICQICLCFSID